MSLNDPNGTLVYMNQYSTCKTPAKKRLINANNATQYSKLGKKEMPTEFQMQLLHDFSKSDNKSNHHHRVASEYGASRVERERGVLMDYKAFPLEKVSRSTTSIPHATLMTALRSL